MAIDLLTTMFIGNLLFGIILLILLIIAVSKKDKKKGNIRKGVKEDLNKIKNQINGKE